MPSYDEAIRGDREAVRIQNEMSHNGHLGARERFKPTSDQVLLRLIAPEQHTHGLYIPDSARRSASELWRGEVIAVGPGEIDKRNGKRIPMAVKPGDRVVCYHIGGNTATHLDDEHIVLSETYIQAVLEAD